MPRIRVQVGVEFGRSGIGYTSFEQARAFYNKNALADVVCDSYDPSWTSLPEEKVHSVKWAGRIERRVRNNALNLIWQALGGKDLMFDKLAARVSGDYDVLLAWGNFAYHTFRALEGSGVKRVLVRGSTHPRFQQKVLEDIAGKHQIEYTPLNQKTLKRFDDEGRMADLVVVPSELAKQSYIDEGYAPEKIIMVAWGVDLDRFTPRVKAKENTPLKFLFVGQACMRKGVSTLLSAWRAVSNNDWELTLIGSTLPDGRAALEQLCALPNVKHIPFTLDVEQYFQEADVFVMPTLEEGSALVSYQAMACGVPQITTNACGAVARADKDAIIIPEASDDALVNALRKLGENEGLRKQMGASSREYIEGFPWQRHGDAVLSAIEKL